MESVSPTVVAVQPLRWREWEDHWNGKALKRCIYIDGNTFHEVSELGETTNGYRYGVSFRHYPLLNVVVRPGCCCHLTKCPYIGRKVLPTNPCREALRRKARVLAYYEWVKFVESMVGGGQ